MNGGADRFLNDNQDFGTDVKLNQKRPYEIRSIFSKPQRQGY